MKNNRLIIKGIFLIGFLAISANSVFGQIFTPRLKVMQELDGYTGIGTDAPQYELDVVGTVNASQVLINGEPVTNAYSRWLVDDDFIYFGANSLDQSVNTNYALLQHRTEGTTHLNSPDMVYIRVGGQEKVRVEDSGVTFNSGFNNIWPYDNKHTYFGTTSLDQSINTNYALLQHNTTGATHLNSPNEVWIRVGGEKRLLADVSGITFYSGFNNVWPYDDKHTYFGTTSLDQSINTNYALLQHNTTGATHLNSPNEVWIRVGGEKRLLADASGITFYSGFNNVWPYDDKHTYFGTTSLDQSINTNYALLQHNTTGATHLNSPNEVWIRVGGEKRLLADASGITFYSGFNNIWPVDNNFTYFGSTSLDQSVNTNFALIQNKNNGRTVLNSPDRVSVRVNGDDKIILDQLGVEFTSGFMNTWPVSSSFNYFGSTELDQSDPINYALMQNKTNGKTYLNSPEEIRISIAHEEKIFISNNGRVGVNNVNPQYDLHVTGSVKGSTLHTDTQSWSDFVFEDDYALMGLEETEKFILKNNHLPDVPSESEVIENGINVGQMDAKLLQKIEELTLHLIEMNKKLDAQNARIQELEAGK